jgi:hypothetical protein
MTSSSITLRPAAADDAFALAVLAELDSHAVPAAPRLVAERDGRIVAAVSEADGSAIADPFIPTSESVALLVAWAARRRHGTGRRLHFGRLGFAH